MNNSAPSDTSSERGDPTLYFRIRAACQDVVHHLIRTVEKRHGESTPLSALEVTFDWRHATRPCLWVLIEEIEIVHVADSTPQASNLTIDEFASSSSRPTNRGINMPNKISEASVEATYEQGYDSDGELPFLGDMEFKRRMTKVYNESVAT